MGQRQSQPVAVLETDSGIPTSRRIRHSLNKRRLWHKTRQQGYANETNLQAGVPNHLLPDGNQTESPNMGIQVSTHGPDASTQNPITISMLQPGNDTGHEDIGRSPVKSKRSLSALPADFGSKAHPRTSAPATRPLLAASNGVSPPTNTPASSPATCHAKNYVQTSITPTTRMLEIWFVKQNEATNGESKGRTSLFHEARNDISCDHVLGAFPSLENVGITEDERGSNVGRPEDVTSFVPAKPQRHPSDSSRMTVANQLVSEIEPSMNRVDSFHAAPSSLNTRRNKGKEIATSTNAEIGNSSDTGKNGQDIHIKTILLETDSAIRYDPESTMTGEKSKPCHVQTFFGVAEQIASDYFFALSISDESRNSNQRLLAAQEKEDYNLAQIMQEEENCRRAAEFQQQFRDCTVCCESFHPLTFPAKPPSSQCTHKAEVCPPCLQEWVSTKVNNNSRKQIDCPQCTKPLNHNDVRRACNTTTFEKYDRFATLDVVDNLNDFYWCLRSGCTAGQEQEHANLGYMKCHACNYEQCLHHKTPWHAGETCQRYDKRLKNQAEKQKRDREEQNSVKYINKQISGALLKKCPKCKTLIQKTGGCDRVICTRRGCGQKFCWVCLAKWEDMLELKQMAHAATCRYRTGVFPYTYR